MRSCYLIVTRICIRKLRLYAVHNKLRDCPREGSENGK
jgi:hypothetical protein